MENSLIPTKRRERTQSVEGTQNEEGFFFTPNGSFWDFDGEYFNRHKYDINGGHYTEDFDYVYGPDFNYDLGCYNCEKEKYLKIEEEEELSASYEEEEEILD